MVSTGPANGLCLAGNVGLCLRASERIEARGGSKLMRPSADAAQLRRGAAPATTGLPERPRPRLQFLSRPLPSQRRSSLGLRDRVGTTAGGRAWRARRTGLPPAESAAVSEAATSL